MCILQVEKWDPVKELSRISFVADIWRMLSIYPKRGRGISIKGIAHNTGIGFVIVTLNNQKSVIQPVATTQCVVVGGRSMKWEGQCESSKKWSPRGPLRGVNPSWAAGRRAVGGRPRKCEPQGAVTAGGMGEGHLHQCVHLSRQNQ